MDETLTHILRDGLMLALMVSLPAVGAALLVGLVVGTLQTLTQLGDPTVASVPRLLAVAGVLALGGSWIGTQVVRFAQTTFETIGR